MTASMSLRWLHQHQPKLNGFGFNFAADVPYMVLFVDDMDDVSEYTEVVEMVKGFLAPHNIDLSIALSLQKANWEEC